MPTGRRRVRLIWVRRGKPTPDFYWRVHILAFGPSGTEYRFGRSIQNRKWWSVVVNLHQSPSDYLYSLVHGPFAYCVRCVRLRESLLQDEE